MKSTGTAATTYVYDAAGLLVAEYGTPSAPDSGTKYVSVDHLGSTRLVTDAAQNQEICYDYLPFGELIPTGTDGRSGGCYGSTATPLTQKFTGMERDQETNNDFFQARYMSAPQMRFTSPDPLGNFVANAADPQSWNMYAYARNNPLAFVDPTGLDYCQTSDGAENPSPEYGGPDAATCADLGGTWQYSLDITENVNQYNSGIETYYIDDGWLNQWSAQNGPMGAGYTFYVTGTTTPLGNPSALPPPNTTPPANNGFGKTPVHGPWTYGNWCGPGGSGTPTNPTDAACMAHDLCYDQAGLTAGSNFQGSNAQLQACNQQLCDAVGGQTELPASIAGPQLAPGDSTGKNL